MQPLSARERMAATRFGDVRHVEVTGSTNSDVMALGRDGAAEGVVVVARSQTAGRGRRGRSWEAAPGDALLMSALLRPPAAVAPLVTAALALAAHDASVAAGAAGVGLKWPNDLVAPAEDADGAAAPERKLAGILAESDWPARANISAGWSPPAPGERALVAAGLGMNLHWPPWPAHGGGEGPAGDRRGAPRPVPKPGGGDGPQADEVAARAVSLDQLAGSTSDAEAVLAEVLVALDHWYGVLVERGPEPVLDEWRSRCVTLGRRVRVDLGAEDVVGRAVAIDDDGHLVVETLEGERRALAVGDVVHVRRCRPS